MKCRDVERALRSLGFTKDPGRGTNHDQWRIIRDGRMYKVTVSCHKGEVKAKDIRSIISQAGVTRREWYDAAER